MGIVLALFLATVSGQFGFNPFRLFGGRRPSRPASRPAPRPTSFRTAPATAPAAGGARSCNQGFHVSSQHFSWQGARNYCTSNGMRASSLETQAKVGTAYNLVRPLKYFWTGGSVNHGRRTLAGPMVPHQPQIGHQLAVIDAPSLTTVLVMKIALQS